MHRDDGEPTVDAAGARTLRHVMIECLIELIERCKCWFLDGSVRTVRFYLRSHQPTVHEGEESRWILATCQLQAVSLSTFLLSLVILLFLSP